MVYFMMVYFRKKGEDMAEQKVAKQWQRSVAPVPTGTRGCSVTFEDGTFN